MTSRTTLLLGALLLAGATLPQEAPPPAPSFADLVRDLDHKEEAVRKAAFERLRAAEEGARKLPGALEALRSAWLKKALEERSLAFRDYADARKKRTEARTVPQRQKLAAQIYETGDFKRLEAFVKKLWEDNYPDPVRAADDAAVQRAIRRVAELGGQLRAIGAPPKDAADEKLREAFRAMDEEILIGAMPPSDQEVMRENAKVRASVSAEEYRLVFITNKYRVSVGRNAFPLSVKLCTASRDHSKDMVEKNFFSHESPIPGKKTFGDRAALQGASAGGENIFAGSPEGEPCFWAWFHSKGHHANILGGGPEIGVGNHQGHWTEMFGK